MADRFPKGFDYVVSRDGSKFDSTQFSEICRATQVPLWDTVSGFLYRSCIHSGFSEDAMKLSWPSIIKDLTNFEWTAFFHCPQINMPRWPSDIIKLFRRSVP